MMVEVGKKYRLGEWPKDKLIEVLFIGKEAFLGRDQHGNEDAWLINLAWIEVKQRPRTLADCHKAGEFGPRMVVINSRDVSDVHIRGAERSDQRWSFFYQVEYGRMKSVSTGVELSDWLVWPIEMIEDTEG